MKSFMTSLLIICICANSFVYPQGIIWRQWSNFWKPITGKPNNEHPVAILSTNTTPKPLSSTSPKPPPSTTGKRTDWKLVYDVDVRVNG